MSKLTWIVDWVLDDGKDTLPEDVAAWRASIYRWVLIVLFGVGGAWLLWFLGNYAAYRARQPFEGFATLVWVGHTSTARDTGSATQKTVGARGTIYVWQDGALVRIDGFSEPILYTTDSRTLTKWFHAGDRVRVKYKRGTFLFWEYTGVVKLMTLNGSEQTHAL